MPTSNPLHFAVQSNNEACRLLRKQRFTEATSFLMDSLKATKEAALFVQQSELTTDSSSMTACHMIRPSQQKRTSVDLKSLSFSHGSCSSTLPHVFIEPLEIEWSQVNQNAISGISFIVMFNLGLANHIIALTSGNEVQTSRREFIVARRLYGLTFRLLSQAEERNLVLTAALLNNLALVCDVLGEAGEANRYKQLLLNVLLLLVDIGGNSEGYEADLEGFMGNVIHLIMKESPVASAA